ncbi:MAG: GtrA family protein [Pseudomonas sp.]|uniref:GtrA family protein n=1 Tax=Pseudomonas abieticivorans TaxID=2931382 RepID=UPI0020BDD958|nr:GtrA family protein [Pseudomonas sp. PIA16]MDE1164233.1 GtrA family protein [Pseudomonas sp.]
MFMNKQFVKFLVTGGTAAAVNFFSRILYNQWTSFSTAVILAYLTGMVTAFFLAKTFVFKENTQPLKHSVLFFVLVNLVAVVQTYFISLGMAYYLLPALNVTFLTKEISHAVGVVVPVFTSYLGHKHLSFRDK